MPKKPQQEKPAPYPPDFTLEQELGASATCRVAGVDEAGRGALAGPVVAAAVILDPLRLPQELKGSIRDSKQVPPRRREEIAERLPACAEIATGEASAAEVDKLGVVAATLKAMTTAVAGLERPPQAVLIDGMVTPSLSCESRAIVKGDRLSLSIAAASIIAKVTRDRIMSELASQFPVYGWEHNFGYGTVAHLSALIRYGPTPHHRRTFAPVRATISVRG